MRPWSVALAIVLTCAAVPTAQPGSAASFQNFYVTHRWFELRDAIAGKPVPPRFSGAVAAAFNRDADAERDLKLAIREAPTKKAANDVRELLAAIYIRTGRSADLVRLLDDAVAATPGGEDLKNARDAFEPLRDSPDQSARHGRGRPFPCTVKDDGVFLPLVVNGKAVEWIVDSGFSNVAMSESEARMLGIVPLAGHAKAGDFAGGTTSMRMSIADRLTIGDAELRHVPVLVFPDAQPPWNELPPGKKGTIGLPLLLALQGIHWTKSGLCSVGPGAGDHDGASAPPNLALDQSTPIVRVGMGAAPLDFVLDTGNQGGFQLWDRFAREFPDIARSGRKTTTTVNQIGGSSEQNIIEIPELRLRVGGLDTLTRPARLFSPPVGTAFQHGNIGMSVLSQASEVRIDFTTMTVSLR